MKNQRALLFSLACGLFAVLLTGLYVSRKESFYAERYQKVAVLVAKKDIARYDTIDDTMIKVEEVPQPWVQPLAVTIDEKEQVIGYMADATIKENEQITKTKLARPGEGRISINVPETDRACTVAVNEVTGIAGLIRPGDHVDVIGVYKTLDEKTRIANQAEAVTIFQNIPVLSVGRNYMYDKPEALKGEKGIFAAGGGGSDFSNVTLLVSPRQCMDLAVAQQVGVLTLSLRSFLNRFGGETFKSLFADHSTTSSVTGIHTPVEMSKVPKWLELRGEHAVMAP